ncbi:MAG: hypothetical protein ACI9JL_004014 [Paracoccaceae bacterium]|jgi:hypothetical protein
MFSRSPKITQKALSGLAISALAMTLSVSAQAGPVDLNTWVDEPAGAGIWTVAADGTFVDQSRNGAPTFFRGNLSALNQTLTSKIQVRTSSDDDFIGFAIGFDAGEATSASADYLLLDWKQGDQSGATDGLAVSRVRGLRTSDNDFWAHVNSVEELARATNLGSTGWADNIEYEFTINFTASSLQVLVDGVEEFNFLAADVGDGTAFNGGNFAFYNYSQGSVRYSAVTQDTFAVPEPGTLAVIGLGLIGFGIARRRTRRL